MVFRMKLVHLCLLAVLVLVAATDVAAECRGGEFSDENCAEDILAGQDGDLDDELQVARAFDKDGNPLPGHVDPPDLSPPPLSPDFSPESHDAELQASAPPYPPNKPPMRPPSSPKRPPMRPPNRPSSPAKPAGRPNMAPNRPLYPPKSPPMGRPPPPRNPPVGKSPPYPGGPPNGPPLEDDPPMGPPTGPNRPPSQNNPPMGRPNGPSGPPLEDDPPMGPGESPSQDEPPMGPPIGPNNPPVRPPKRPNNPPMPPPADPSYPQNPPMEPPMPPDMPNDPFWPPDSFPPLLPPMRPWRPWRPHRPWSRPYRPMEPPKDMYVPSFRSQVQLPADCGRPGKSSRRSFRESSFPRIYSGFEAREAQFPSFVQLYLRAPDQPEGRVEICGGTIISPYHILTAAHCAKNKIPSETLIGPGIGGVREASNRGKLLRAQKHCVSSRYHQSGKQSLSEPFTVYDVAIIKLKRPVRFTNKIQPACLPKKPLQVGGEQAYSIGMGTSYKDPETDEATFPKRLKVLPVVRTACEGSERHKSLLCARGNDARFPVGKICQGDSGGPVIALDGRGRQTVYGLHSYGAAICMDYTKLRRSKDPATFFLTVKCADVYNIRAEIDKLMAECA